jgi:uncharacterized lipoprotein YajG
MKNLSILSTLAAVALLAACGQPEEKPATTALVPPPTIPM